MSQDTTNNAYLEPSYYNNNNYNNLYEQKINNIHVNPYNNYQISRINHNENNSNKPTKELDEFRNAIINRGKKGIFIFQKILNLYDKNRTGEISYNKFNELLEIFNITLNKQKINLIFQYYDNEKKGIIKYNDLIIDLIGNINQNRELIIKNVYNNFIRGEGSNISLNDLKQKFKGYNHPDVKSGLRSETEVYYDFLEMIDIFKNYKNNVKLENNDIFTYEDFLDFYKEISISIKDDKAFEDLLFLCWNNNKDKNVYDFERNGGLNNLQDNNLRIRTANQILNNKGYNY
jgi:Ca2+-binding EF-hand superfamily protein